MAKTPRKSAPRPAKPAASKSAPPRFAAVFAANPGLRSVAIRVGAAVVLIGLGAGLYTWREHGAKVAISAPPVVAVAPERPAPRPTVAPAAPPSPTASAPVPPRREASAEDSKPMSASLRAAFDSWLLTAYAKCWKAPKTLPDGDPYLPKVRVAYKEDGELASPPKLVNPPSDPAWKPHAQAALNAVKGCDPLHVPDKYAEYYPSWKSRTVYFDPARN